MNLKILNQLLQSFSKIESIDAEKFIESQQLAPVISVRLNPYKPSDKFSKNTSVPWSTNGKYLDERPNFTADPLLHAGCYYVQEASSMFLEYALKKFINFDETVLALDMCAAPGGKSTLVSSLLNDSSLLIANEVISTRASILSENLVKWGKMNTWVTQNDPKQFSALENKFDFVLIDAPCSGSGLFRKKNEFADEWNMELVHLCSQRQKRIMHDAFPCLKDEGLLVYMTCSFCEEENEEMVDYILENFDVESERIEAPKEWGIVETESENKKGYAYRFFPHLLRGEGFFLACFRKINAGSSHQNAEPIKIKTFKNEFPVLSDFIDMENKIAMLRNDNIMILEAAHEEHLNYFDKHLRLIKKGVFAGKIIRGELIPEHELAMYTDAKTEIPSVELSLQNALQYLKKEPFEINTSIRGWLLVKYQGQNLGWVKHLGNRFNNYYPLHFRILNKKI